MFSAEALVGALVSLVSRRESTASVKNLGVQVAFHWTETEKLSVFWEKAEAVATGLLRFRK